LDVLENISPLMMVGDFRIQGSLLALIPRRTHDLKENRT
jgi:hypothetical protein